MFTCPRCKLEAEAMPRACPRCALTLDPVELESWRRAFREQVLDHLEMLGDFQRQLDYQRNVPIADVVAELLCQWFDDLGFGDERRRGSHEFGTTFTETEWDVLDEFSTLFDDAIRRVEARTWPSPELAALQGHPEWSRLAAAANSVAARLRHGPP